MRWNEMRWNEWTEINRSCVVFTFHRHFVMAREFWINFPYLHLYRANSIPPKLWYQRPLRNTSRSCSPFYLLCKTLLRLIYQANPNSDLPRCNLFEAIYLPLTTNTQTIITRTCCHLIPPPLERQGDRVGKSINYLGALLTIFATSSRCRRSCRLNPRNSSG